MAKNHKKLVPNLDLEVTCLCASESKFDKFTSRKFSEQYCVCYNLREVKGISNTSPLKYRLNRL